MTKYGKDPSTAHIRETGESKFNVVMSISGHQLTGDEPKDDGGENLGPNPYDYLLAALGSCTAMTVRWYADKKGWPLTNVDVKLSHKKVHAKDCDDCENTPMIDLIEKELTIEGDELTLDQLNKLLEISEKCPVHKTLQKEVKITTDSGNL